MHVTFKRTGERRYAVIVSHAGRIAQAIHPAPGYDDDIPHDLVHYVVEAALGLTSGVFGRAALGGGTFLGEGAGSARERARERRKQVRKEAGLSARDRAGANELESSERLAALCDVSWRRRHGQRPDPLRKAPDLEHAEDAARIERVVSKLDVLAPLWRALPVEGELVFEWPSVLPCRS
ncbi:MAG TPA: hypothetical protein VFX59_09710 [Polyangiales bacterium]|nr:hypothetical protein [Polyangiales bacterium]